MTTGHLGDHGSLIVLTRDKFSRAGVGENHRSPARVSPRVTSGARQADDPVQRSEISVKNSEYFAACGGNGGQATE